MAEIEQRLSITEQALSTIAKRDELASALGNAISRWANAEFALVSIFATATRLEMSMAAAILTNIRAFSLLSDICNSAVRHRLNGARELVYWNSLVEYVVELSGDRNYIAHKAMIFHGTGLSHFDGENTIGPDLLSVLSGDVKIRLPVDVHELRQLLEDFQQLIELLVDFDQALKKDATSQEKYFVPIVRRRPPRKQRTEAAQRTRGRPPSRKRRLIRGSAL